MKVHISSHMKSHIFNLVAGLEQRGMIERFYTIYPFFKMRDYQIPIDRTYSFRTLAAITFLLTKINLIPSAKLFSTAFDRYVSKKLCVDGKGKIFHAISGYGLNSMKKAKQLGMKVFLDRSASHIDYQMMILNKEISDLMPTMKEDNKLKNALYEKIRAEFEIADRIIVPSHYVYNSFIQEGVSGEKLSIAPLCKPKNIIYQKNKKSNKKTFTFLAIGYNFYCKGFYYLIKAWRQMNLPNAKLIIRNCIPTAFKKLTDHPSIHIIYRHLSSELNNLYNNADIFCLPSVDEGFGLVGLEAMAAGLPVIVTENVGMSDAITDGEEGFIIPIRNSEAIQSAIIKLYNNKALKNYMSFKAREKEKQYTLNRYIERIVNIYAS